MTVDRSTAFLNGKLRLIDRQLTVRHKSCAMCVILSTAGRSSKAFRAKMLPIYGYGVNVNRLCQ